MITTADQTLDNIRRSTDLVISHIKDPKRSMDQKIIDLEMYVAAVDTELDFRPPRKRKRRFFG